MKKFFFGSLLLIYSASLLATLDSDFVAARQAFQKGDIKRLNEYAQRLENHALFPYIEYYQLRMVLRTTDISDIRNFLARHEGSLVANRLRSDWLKVLGKAQNWSLFAEEYPALVNQDNELLCYSYQQRLAARDMTVFSDARPLWFTAQSMPESCTPVFSALISQGQITPEDIWARIRMALEEGQTGVATFVSRRLPNSDPFNINQLDQAAKNPLRYLEANQDKIKTRSDREIALFALLRLLRNDTNQAYVQWKKIEKQLTPIDRSYFLARLGYRAAMRHDDRALDWFKEAQKGTTVYAPTDTILAWKARAALRIGDWDQVLSAIHLMSSKEQQEDTWRYWKARALQAQAKTKEANQILLPLSEKHSYYGQLAKEELGTILSIADKNYQSSQQEISAMEQLPGVQRTLAFARINLRTDAYHEWVWTIRNFNDVQLLAAAEVAYRNGLYDRAINTANRTVSQHNFKLRFLSPHRETLQNIARKQDLDEAWVFGLIRQESRFIADIKSHAGASGLMQLMPATAEWVAKQLGISNFRQNLVTEVDTNLKLGTYYLKHVLTTLDHQPLLASAAYNAGPGRAKRWRDSRVLEGAIYAETIPFNETRDYVKKVLKNSVYYAQVLEHGQNTPTLKERLGSVAAKK